MGKVVLRLGRDVSTDDIYPGRFMATVLPSETPQFCLGLGWENLSRQFIITVALCGYALFLETLGFLVSGFFLMWIMFLVDNPRKWHTHMLTALIVINVTYLVLSKLLRVIFPAGIFRLQW